MIFFIRCMPVPQKRLAQTRAVMLSNLVEECFRTETDNDMKHFPMTVVHIETLDLITLKHEVICM